MKQHTSKYALIGILTISIYSSIFCDSNPSAGITYSFGGGRLGDNLYTYAEARWLAHSKGLEFFYRPFEYSQFLNMHRTHKNYRDHNHLRIKSTTDINIIDSEQVDNLYVISPFISNNHINWDDPAFYNMLEMEISPMDDIPPVEVPSGHICIGLHVRRGGGFDNPLKQKSALINSKLEDEDDNDAYADVQYPNRFPPDSFFISQLKYILDRFPERNLYVHIFSDDPRPDLIAEKYHKMLPSSNITYGYRKDANKHNANVLNDFFMISRCDIVIRADSFFSEMACHVGRVKLELWPNKSRWEKDTLLVTQIGIKERDQKKWGTKTYYLVNTAS